MPIKMPFFGKAVSLVIRSSDDCSNEIDNATLCFMSGRWHWRLRSQARIPLPPWEDSGSHIEAQKGSERSIADSGPTAMPHMTAFETQVNRDSAAALPGLGYAATGTQAATPQTIAALRNEIAAAGDPSYESRHQVEPDCGIQFGV
jgi:hypothetical protein